VLRSHEQLMQFRQSGASTEGRRQENRERMLRIVVAQQGRDYEIVDASRKPQKAGAKHSFE
jgi:hypothetical protein